VHVVLPNTSVASQARSSGASSNPENVTSDKSGSSSKLLGRGSSTLLDKIKADFNISSKSAPDRVEQIRLQIAELPSNAVPANPQSGAADYQESPQEQAKTWNDLMNKLKALILSSFSLRVNQYEEDIRERDAQRSLPGWNFCTFFVLKEALLHGFESVGLVDDALVGYDELSLGLESAMSQDDGTIAHADTFLAYTKEMKDILMQCLTSDATSEIIWASSAQIISTTRKDYRNLIVNSNVSRFDFQCYIFARQMAILLRMSHSNLSRKSSSQVKTTAPVRLSSLAALCRRTIEFISQASRTLNAELLEA
jgi:hypothetical protein